MDTDHGSGRRNGAFHRIRTAAGLATLSLLLTASAGSLIHTVLAEPGERWQRGQPRPWYSTERLAQLLESRGRHASSESGLARRMLDHTGMADFRGSPTPLLLPNPGQATRAVGDVQDAWSPLVRWSNEASDLAIHAALMPDGRVTFFGQRPFSMRPHPLNTPIPQVAEVTAEAIPLEFSTPATSGNWTIHDLLACTSATFLSDGRLFAASGTRVLANSATGEQYILGLADALAGRDGMWTGLPGMLSHGALPEPARWYPTATRLADKRVLVTGGLEAVKPWVTKQLSAEVYDPTTNTWQVITPQGQLPEGLISHNYTHVFQLPTATSRGDVLAFGEAGTPTFMSPSGSWTASSSQRPGWITTRPWQTSVLASTTMLPLRHKEGEWGYSNGSVVQVTGQHGSSSERKADVYDPVLDRWTASRDLEVFRAHPASVLLPDARILIVGGEDYMGSTGLGRAQYLDPRNNLAVTWGIDEYPEVRGYHNVAVLLPDGRVLLGSGKENYVRAELTSFRYYYPSYMFQPRPVIEAAPATLNLGSYGWVTWEGEKAPAEVVLIGLGAMTHSFDMNQRYVQLPIHSSGVNDEHRYTIFGTPADARIAPPGPYMLFILDENHVPSVARMVQVQVQ